MSALYDLFLGAVGRRNRLYTLGGIALLGIALGVIVGLGDDPDRGAEFVNGFGLTLFLPIASLVLASSALGDPLEDGTLVYLWLKPIERWRIVVSAAAASASVALPTVGVPLVIASGLTRGGADLMLATAVASTVGVIAYTGIFTYFGLRVRRALVWGLVYILVWEGFIARAGLTASRFAVRSHTRSILARITDTDFDLADFSTGYAVIVPVLVAAVALALATRRLTRTDIA